MKPHQRRSLNWNPHRAVISLNNLLFGFLEYCWAVLVVLNGNSVYHANAVRNYQLLPLCVVMTVVLLAVNILFGRIRIKKRNLLIAVGLCLYALVYYVVRQDRMSAMNFLYLFILGLPCLFLLFAELHRKGELLGLIYRLSNVVYIFAVMSLFFWVFGVILNVIQPNMSTRINWGNIDRVEGYWGLHFLIQRDTTFGTWIYRNSGIFAEAPMLNLWTNIALAVELFLRNKPSKLKVGIFILTIITTMSTTGFVFIALCILLKYYDSFGKMGTVMKLLLLLVGLMTIPFVLYSVNLLLVEKSDTVSFAMRLSDYIAGLQLWWDYPLFGSGFGTLSYLMQYTYSASGAIGYSNSIMAVPATGGLWMTLLYYIPHFAATVPSLTKSKAFFCFSICFVYLFVTTVFFARYLAVVMIALDMAVLLERKNSAGIAA